MKRFFFLFIFLASVCMPGIVLAEYTFTIFPSPDAHELAIAPDGSIWIGGDEISRYDIEDETWTVYNKNEELFESVVIALLAASDGTIWVGTQENVLKFDGNTWTTYTSENGYIAFIDDEGKAHESVSAIEEAPDGKIWFGTQGGVSVFDGESWESFSVEDGLPGYDVGSIAFGHDGSVWVTVLYQGASRYYNGVWETYTEEDGIVNIFLRGATVGPDGTIWCASARGACSYKNGVWTTYTEDDGLAYRQTKGFLFYPDDTVWIGTLRGISIFDGSTWKTITSEDGLAADNVWDMDKGLGNDFWIVTGGLVTVIDTDDKPTSVDAPINQPDALPVITTYPNPFNPSTTIEFKLPADGYASLTIFTHTGQKVRTLTAGYITEGIHRITWDGRDNSGNRISSGVYLSKLVAGEHMTSGRMVLVR